MHQVNLNYSNATGLAAAEWLKRLLSPATAPTASATLDLLSSPSFTSPLASSLTSSRSLSSTTATESHATAQAANSSAGGQLQHAFTSSGTNSAFHLSSSSGCSVGVPSLTKGGSDGSSIFPPVGLPLPCPSSFSYTPFREHMGAAELSGQALSADTAAIFTPSPFVVGSPAQQQQKQVQSARGPFVSPTSDLPLLPLGASPQSSSSFLGGITTLPPAALYFPNEPSTASAMTMSGAGTGLPLTPTLRVAGSTPSRVPSLTLTAAAAQQQHQQQPSAIAVPQAAAPAFDLNFPATWPDQAKIHAHQHPLKKTAKVYKGTYNCDVCKDQGQKIAYHCSESSYDVHPACVHQLLALNRH